MAHDENFTRFFCFLSLFAAAMLGLVIANSLLLLFICWEMVGLTSYLLIGFWYHKPSAAAAAKKAFIVTRIGDLAFLLGMVWLYSQTGTLAVLRWRQGCLEASALAKLVAADHQPGHGRFDGIALLIFCGAIGKSGQVPLHVWLPDAMEGPTPVSALIHAATMVAAGVFLVARVYPLMAGTCRWTWRAVPAALQVITWVGRYHRRLRREHRRRADGHQTHPGLLDRFATGLHDDGLGHGRSSGRHVSPHHPRLFQGAAVPGRRLGHPRLPRGAGHPPMGGLRKFMPVTFATYAVGMLALSGFPLLFSGFWSKDEILHAAHGWGVSRWPFYLGIFGALLTAFYMTRQVCYVFFGQRGQASRWPPPTSAVHAAEDVRSPATPPPHGAGGRLPYDPHESPPS